VKRVAPNALVRFAPNALRVEGNARRFGRELRSFRAPTEHGGIFSAAAKKRLPS
jgi:hypothetical protein